MPRPQFTLRALLVAILVVAAFFGGIATQRYFDSRKMPPKQTLPVDIVVGVHSRELEDSLGDFAEKLEQASRQSAKEE